MKKIIIVLLAAAASFTAANKASAQEKGLWIGGKLGYWHDKTEGVKTDSFSIAPEAGYDFNKRWSVGVALGYEYLKVKDGGSANVFTASPYARYKYYNKGILSLFLDGGVGFACCDHEGFQAGITPGLSVKINEHFSFLTQVGFLGYRKDYFNGGSGEAFGLKLSSSDLKFGFYYKFSPTTRIFPPRRSRWRGVFLTTRIRCTYAHAHRTSAVGSPCSLPVPRKPHGKPLRRGHEKRQPHSCNCLIFIGGNMRI